MPDFPVRLGELIAEHGMSQKEFAKKSGVTEAAISRYLSGERRPGANAAMAMASTLGVSVEYLMGGEEAFERTPEVREMLDGLRMRPELRVLFSTSKDATPEDIEEAIRTLERLKEQRGE